MARNKDTRDAPIPVYPKGPSAIPLDSIFRFIGLLKKHGRTAEFRKAAEEAKAFVTADPATVKFVKDFVAADPDLRSDPLGARVIRPPAGGMEIHTLSVDAAQHECKLK